MNEWISEAEARVLLRMATKRFGPAPAEIEDAIRKITLRDRMERMIGRVHEATDWADLLATP